MKSLRSHIIKLCMIGLICSGLGLSAAQPAEAVKSSRDFANWLQSVAKKAQTPEVEHKLASLQGSHANLYRLIEQASQIVSQNNDDFNLPVEGESASKNVHQILLIEWNQFQTGNAMAAVPPPASIKPFISFQSPKSFTGNAESVIRSGSLALFFSAVYSVEKANVSAHHFFITPMSGGTAIGAP